MSENIRDHEDLGTVVTWERDGKPTIKGTCTGVQRRPGNWWSGKTNTRIATVSIRYRIKPGGQPARWTDWFPERAAANGANEE